MGRRSAGAVADMEGGGLRGLAVSPEASQGWKVNFLMSQSPPSYSPQRYLHGTQSQMMSEADEDESHRMHALRRPSRSELSTVARAIFASCEAASPQEETVEAEEEVWPPPANDDGVARIALGGGRRAAGEPPPSLFRSWRSTGGAFLQGISPGVQVLRSSTEGEALSSDGEDDVVAIVEDGDDDVDDIGAAAHGGCGPAPTPGAAPASAASAAALSPLSLGGGSSWEASWCLAAAAGEEAAEHSPGGVGPRDRGVEAEDLATVRAPAPSPPPARAAPPPALSPAAPAALTTPSRAAELLSPQVPPTLADELTTASAQASPPLLATQLDFEAEAEASEEDEASQAAAGSSTVAVKPEEQRPPAPAAAAAASPARPTGELLEPKPPWPAVAAEAADIAALEAIGAVKLEAPGRIDSTSGLRAGPRRRSHSVKDDDDDDGGSTASEACGRIDGASGLGAGPRRRSHGVKEDVDDADGGNSMASRACVRPPLLRPPSPPAAGPTEPRRHPCGAKEEDEDGGLGCTPVAEASQSQALPPQPRASPGFSRPPALRPPPSRSPECAATQLEATGGDDQDEEGEDADEDSHLQRAPSAASAAPPPPSLGSGGSGGPAAPQSPRQSLAAQFDECADIAKAPLAALCEGATFHGAAEEEPGLAIVLDTPLLQEAASAEAGGVAVPASVGAASAEPPAAGVVVADIGACAAPPAAAPLEDAVVAAAAAGGAVVVPASAVAVHWDRTLPSGASQEWLPEGEACALRLEGDEAMRLPRSVHERLYGYQRQGVAWMWNLHCKGFGGILADEMGLGKTVQAAAFLACLRYTGRGSRFLVVAPVTLLPQWKRELGIWTKDVGLSAHVLAGTPRERREALGRIAAEGGVLLVSYDMMRGSVETLRTAGLAAAAAGPPPRKRRRRREARPCRDDDSPSRAEVEEREEAAEADAVPEGDFGRVWDAVIVDEAHQIKNPSCSCGRALRQVEARSRFLLTGTPLQNKLVDLWALMDFAQPALLGNHATFERSFSEQIARGSKKNASRFAVELKDHLARELKRLTAPHFLRRIKRDVAADSSSRVGGAGGALVAVDAGAPAVSPSMELPPKVDVVLWLNLTQAQQELYALCLGTDVVREAADGARGGMETLRAINLLKKLCNHPMLCLPQEEFDRWRTSVAPSSVTADSQQQQQQQQQRPESRAAKRQRQEPPAAAAASADGGPGGAGVAPPPPLAGAAAGAALGHEEESTQAAPECQHVLPRLRALMPSSLQGAALLSCKLRVLSVLLPQLHRGGHRCLIFAHNTRMLDLIQASVLRALGLPFLRIDGTIDPKDRDIKVTKFQQPDSRYFCICMSVHVGGLGFSITGADRVILVDPDWNPSVDAQAVDRVHRIGQEKPVVVYRLIGSGAIEDKMFRLQVFKRGLSKTYLEQEKQLRFFTHKELKTLLEPPSQSSSTQALMAEQIGTQALEHEELLRVVAGDVGSTDDPAALPFWQGSDVLGFSDYQRLFMFLEKAEQSEAEAAQHARDLSALLRSEEYLKDQVVEGKWRVSDLLRGIGRARGIAEEAAPEEPEPQPLQDSA